MRSYSFFFSRTCSRSCVIFEHYKDNAFASSIKTRDKHFDHDWISISLELGLWFRIIVESFLLSIFVYCRLLRALCIRFCHRFFWEVRYKSISCWYPMTWKNEYYKHIKKLLEVCYWVRFIITFFGTTLHWCSGKRFEHLLNS